MLVTSNNQSSDDIYKISHIHINATSIYAEQPDLWWRNIGNCPLVNFSNVIRTSITFYQPQIVKPRVIIERILFDLLQTSHNTIMHLYKYYVYAKKNKKLSLLSADSTAGSRIYTTEYFISEFFLIHLITVQYNNLQLNEQLFHKINI